MQYLWSDIEMEANDLDYIFSEYPSVKTIQQCIVDFRGIFIKKDVALLNCFIETYTKCELKRLATFARGLISDIDAVKNSVVSPLSSGFVEGINNKVKVIKRDMYGRAGLKLLSAKVLFAT